MIQSAQHAERVQRRRYESGLPHHAKAVRRYFARVGDPQGYKRLPALTAYEAWHPRHDHAKYDH